MNDIFKTSIELGLDCLFKDIKPDFLIRIVSKAQIPIEPSLSIRVLCEDLPRQV